MVNRDRSLSPAAASTRQSQAIRVSADQRIGRRWMSALICASMLASQESLSVNAFQITFNPFRAASRRPAQTQFPTTSTATASAVEEARASKLAPNMSPTMTLPSRMFLKSGQVSIQPMSSLSSDFFDTPTTPRPRFSDESDDEVPIYIPQRKRGILGFALNDATDHIFASSKSPPKMEDSSTCLHSSTADERQSSSPKSLDFEAWNLPHNLDEGWSPSPTEDGHNPILNRSPNSNSPAGDDKSASSTASLAWFPWMPSITQIEALKVRELRQICANRGLKQAGNKVDLQQRLWDWTRTQQHRQRRLMIGSNSEKTVGKLFRLETRGPSSSGVDDVKESSSPSANSLGEWADTYNIEPLLQRREKIHKEKREGKTVAKRRGKESLPTGGGAPTTPTKEYLSKLFDAPSSQYSNLEVKQMYKAAKAADQNGDRTLSKQILMKLKDATPHDARVYRRLSRMESEEGNVHEARRVLQEGLRLHPTNAILWHGLGQLEMKAGNDGECRNCFMKAIKLDPAFPNAYHALGTMEHSCGEIARSMKILKTGLQYCPTNHRLHHALGDLYREAKMLDMAERSFRRALEHAPQVSYGFAFTSLAHVAYERGDVDKCRAWLRKTVAINDGRYAKAWLAMARLEESEGNIDGARSVCVTCLNQYEKSLLHRTKKGLSESTKPFTTQTRELTSTLTADPVQLKNEMLQSVPIYRPGDHFLKVYRNWARLEETYGDTAAVDDVYKRAAIAFPLEWQLPLAWAQYHVHKGHHDRARLLFGQACDKAANKHALPYRVYAEFEMSHGRYADARKVLYHGALAMSDSPGGGLENHCGMAELFNTWAVCEWHLDNLSRAEVLFDHSLRLASSGEDGSALRSHILYSIARLEYERGEYHLAQHCICLCLKENAMPGGNSKVWELWGRVAAETGDSNLADQCEDHARLAEVKDSESKHASTLANPMVKADLQRMVRKDPWHYKIFTLETPASFRSAALPED